MTFPLNTPFENLQELKKQLLEKFECQKSGNCCRREGMVYVTIPDMQKMATFLGLQLNAFIQQFCKRENGWYVVASPTHRPNCFLKDDNTCSVYALRPKSCKDYPNWPELWENRESILAELSMCPGLKKAFDRISASK